MKTHVKPKPAAPHKETKRSFCDAASEILEWALITGRGRWEWPIDPPAGSYDETWVSEVFRKLETAFDPAFHEHMPRRTEESDCGFQQRKDAETTERHRALAAAIWECDRGVARRYADVLRTVDKPAGFSDVERRVAFLQEIDRQDKASKAPHKRATGKRGAPPAHRMSDLRKVEAAIAANTGSVRLATQSIYEVTPDSPQWPRCYRLVKAMHDDTRKRGLSFYAGKRN